MANEATKTAKLSIEGEATIELPIYAGNEGQDVIDVGKLTSQGYFTYDPGFTSTASCDVSSKHPAATTKLALHL